MLTSIGTVLTDATVAELKTKRKEIISTIRVDEEYSAGLDGVERYSHLYVLFWLHEVPAAELKELRVHPRHRMDLPEVGVFATRSRNHPNPIGLAVVRLLERRGNLLTVQGLDAINGTPVLDIKPYDYLDVKTHLRVPAWWRQLHHEHKRRHPS